VASPRPLYAVIGVVVTVIVILAALYAGGALRPQAPVRYLGSPSGYEGFVPNGQTVNYNGQTDPVGDLILSNGTTLHDVIWNGQYASTIINNHNQIVQLNSQFVGQTDPVNHQPYVPLQDFYVIKGQVPVEQATINGQTYYVIEANKINPADIAGFYTYDKWVSNFVAAMNTPGTYAAGLSGNSPVFQLDKHNRNSGISNNAIWTLWIICWRSCISMTTRKLSSIPMDKYNRNSGIPNSPISALYWILCWRICIGTI